ncbi:MAG: DUF483 domain-containing protein, partial [Myxococcota bacterium]
MWLRFGVLARSRQGSDEPGFGLDLEDREALVSRAGAERWTHVLSNVEPSPSLLRALRRAAPQARVGYLIDDPTPQGEAPHEKAEAVPTSGRGLAGFFGQAEEPARDNLFDSETPAFDWQAGNDAARRAPPLPFLICGQECTFSRSVLANPFFQGVDLDTCARTRGCAFCTGSGDDAKFLTPPANLFRRQLVALQQSHPPWQGRLRVRAVGQPILLNVETVANVLRDTAIDPLDLLLDARTDALVRERSALVAALETLQGSGHRLHIALVGIESFAEADLVRFNKGVRWQTNLRAVEILFELEHAYPETFAFREHGGLSLILLSPWTTPDDLSLNLAIVRRARLASVSGKVFDSRLRLYPSLPLHAKARQDGLLRQRYEDEQLDTARANFYPDETPWRFADPSLEGASRLLVRLQRTDEAGGDAQRALSRLVARTGGTMDPLALAEAIVDAATLEQDADVTRVGVRAEALLKETCTTDSVDSSLALTPDWIAFELGLKPVLRLEPRDQRRLGTLAEDLRKRVPVAIERVVQHGDERDLFVGHRREDVEEAVHVTTELERVEGDGPWPEMVRRLGRLLGYPSCCVERFASVPHYHLDSYTWLHICNRLEAPGSVDPLSNPGPGMLYSHVPCSPTCEQTLRLARAVLDEAGRRTTSDSAQVVVEALRGHHERPWVLIVDRQGVGAELLVDELRYGVCKYEVGAVQGWDPLLDRLREGDSLQLDAQHVNVMRGGRLHAALGARAFVWWHRQPWQHELWSHLVRLRLGSARVDADPRREQVSDRVPAGPDAERLAAWLERVVPDSMALAGFRRGAVKPYREREACVTLVTGRDRLLIRVGQARGDARGWGHVGPLMVYLPEGQVLDSHDKSLAIQALESRLRAELSAGVSPLDRPARESGATALSPAEPKARVLLVGSFRSVVPEGNDGPFGSQGGFVDTLAPAPYSLANGYLKAFIEADAQLRDRYEVRLLDLAQPLELEDEHEEVELRAEDLAWIRDQRPSIIGFSAYCWNFDAVLAAADALREQLPGVQIVIGGRATDADARGILARHPSVDAVVVGEGELAFRDILRSGSLSSVPGVFARVGEQIECGGPPRSIERLDDIPSPWLGGILAPVKNAMMMELSRGCLHACGYCTWNSDKRLRYFSAERIEREIAWAVAQGHEH